MCASVVAVACKRADVEGFHKEFARETNRTTVAGRGDGMS